MTQVIETKNAIEIKTVTGTRVRILNVNHDLTFTLGVKGQIVCARLGTMRGKEGLIFSLETDDSKLVRTCAVLDDVTKTQVKELQLERQKQRKSPAFNNIRRTAREIAESTATWINFFNVDKEIVARLSDEKDPDALTSKKISGINDVSSDLPADELAIIIHDFLEKLEIKITLGLIK
jgi:hypothetical protein